jgi:hypothetical protein
MDDQPPARPSPDRDRLPGGDAAADRGRSAVPRGDAAHIPFWISRSGIPYHARRDVYAALDGYARSRADGFVQRPGGDDGAFVADRRSAEANLDATTGTGTECLNCDRAADTHLAAQSLDGEQA